LSGDGPAFEQILGALVLQLREIERGFCLVQAATGRDEIVLRCTVSAASITNSAWPWVTLSPGRASSLVTRPA